MKTPLRPTGRGLTWTPQRTEGDYWCSFRNTRRSIVFFTSHWEATNIRSICWSGYVQFGTIGISSWFGFGCQLCRLWGFKMQTDRLRSCRNTQAKLLMMQHFIMFRWLLSPLFLLCREKIMNDQEED